MNGPFYNQNRAVMNRVIKRSRCNLYCRFRELYVHWHGHQVYSLFVCLFLFFFVCLFVVFFLFFFFVFFFNETVPYKIDRVSL